MKTILIIAALLLSMGNTRAQSYTLTAQGKLISSPPRNDRKKDSVFTVINGDTLYRGKKGGIWFWNKNGKKQYIRKIKP